MRSTLALSHTLAHANELLQKFTARVKLLALSVCAPPPNWLPHASCHMPPCPPSCVETNESLIWRISEFIIIKITRCLQCSNCCCCPCYMFYLWLCETSSLRLLPLTPVFGLGLDANFLVFGFRSWHSSTFCVNVTESAGNKYTCIGISHCFCHIPPNWLWKAFNLSGIVAFEALIGGRGKCWLKNPHDSWLFGSDRLTNNRHFFIIFPSLDKVNSFALLSVCTTDVLVSFLPLEHHLLSTHFCVYVCLT